MQGHGSVRSPWIAVPKVTPPCQAKNGPRESPEQARPAQHHILSPPRNSRCLRGLLLHNRRAGRGESGDFNEDLPRPDVPSCGRSVLCRIHDRHALLVFSSFCCGRYARSVVKPAIFRVINVLCWADSLVLWNSSPRECFAIAVRTRNPWRSTEMEKEQQPESGKNLTVPDRIQVIQYTG